MTVGGMGHAGQIAAGIALARQDRQVVCLDGDGAVFMHMGALAVSADCSNLLHIVLNNGCYDSVGGQPTKGAFLDFTRIAGLRIQVRLPGHDHGRNRRECSGYVGERHEFIPGNQMQTWSTSRPWPSRPYAAAKQARSYAIPSRRFMNKKHKFIEDFRVAEQNQRKMLFTAGPASLLP